MGDVVTLSDEFFYITDDDGDFCAVQWFNKDQFVRFNRDGYVDALQKTDGSGIKKHELKNLMVMWLALEYPDVLAYDVEKEEESARESTDKDSIDK